MRTLLLYDYFERKERDKMEMGKYAKNGENFKKI